MAEVTFRPIDAWPGGLTPDSARERNPFRANYSDTLEVLDRELDVLDARLVVIQLALGPADIRRDGLPRANARPEHPGVILSFESMHGPLRYLTDRFAGGSVWRSSSKGGSFHMPGWQVNLRAIALGLEALRKVDRYGITKRGEQYRGWAELPAGIAQPATHMTTEDAATFIVDATDRWGDDAAQLRDDILAGRPRALEVSYRLAAKHLHPDHGGDAAAFQKLQAAKALLDREAGRG